jgi:uncharacterized protein (UPF0335 family)
MKTISREIKTIYAKMKTISREMKPISREIKTIYAKMKTISREMNSISREIKTIYAKMKNHLSRDETCLSRDKFYLMPVFLKEKPYLCNHNFKQIR